MRRDDWMYDEDEYEEEGESRRKPEESDRQCPNCLRWVAAESPYCAWCCKPLEKKK